MPANATIQSIAFIQVPPIGGGDPMLINPAAIANVGAFHGDPYGEHIDGATIYLMTSGSGRIQTSLSVAQVLALLTPA